MRERTFKEWEALARSIRGVDIECEKTPLRREVIVSAESGEILPSSAHRDIIKLDVLHRFGAVKGGLELIDVSDARLLRAARETHNAHVLQGASAMAAR
jgi:hypothetical protein